MVEGGGAPPPEAVRRGRGVSAAVTVVVAIVTFLAGLGAGAIFLVAPPAPAKPLLVLGTNTPFEPFEFYDANDNLVGFDVELIQEMVTRAGFTYTWRDFTSFDPLLFAIAAEGVDVGVGALTQNLAVGQARNESMKFTNPYYEADQGVLKKKGDLTNYCAAADCTQQELNRTDLIIGVQKSTTSEYYVLDNLPAVGSYDNPDTDHLITFPKVPQVLQALQAGTVDIVIIDKPAADGIAAANPNDYEVDGTIQTNELYGFAVAKADPKGLIPKLNAALAEVRRDGTYQRIFDKWF